MSLAITRIPYTGTLPDAFFDLVPAIYTSLPYSLDEVPDAVRQLFELEADRNEIILYTNNKSFRLAGIFPHQSDEAFFGFWETTNDPELNKQAFALLEEDAQIRGRKNIIGPFHFNSFQRYRLRLDVPVWGEFDREPVNPFYYPVILETLGFAVRNTFESRLVLRHNVPVFYSDKKVFLEELEKIPYDFMPVNPETWQIYEHEIYTLVQEVFGNNPNYRPVSKEQFNMLYNASFAEKLCPHSSVLFWHKETGKLVALSFCHPNYQALQLPEGVAPAFERDYPKLEEKTLLVKSVGVHPNFRRQGLMSFLGAYAMQSFRELYDEAIFCLMRSDNFSVHFSDGLPYESATYALFEKRLDK